MKRYAGADLKYTIHVCVCRLLQTFADHVSCELKGRRNKYNNPQTEIQEETKVKLH